MLGEKRQYRLDFIKALGRVFEYDAAKSTEVKYDSLRVSRRNSS